MSEKVSCSSKVDRAYPTAAFSDSITYHHSRRDREMVMVLLCDHDSSSDSSSSEEDDLELLLLDLTETPKRSFGPRLNLEDLGTLDCEQMFRLALVMIIR